MSGEADGQPDAVGLTLGMSRCKCVIHQGGELRLGLLGLRGEIMRTIGQTRAIRLKQYNQRHDQSNMTSDTIGTNPGVVMVTSSVTSMQKPKT